MAEREQLNNPDKEFKITENELRRRLTGEQTSPTYRLCRGNSMTPLINIGEVEAITPLTEQDKMNLQVGDILAAQVGRKVFCHLLYAINQEGSYLIGNNHGHINGMSTRVFGKVTGILQEDGTILSIETRKEELGWQLPMVEQKVQKRQS